MDIQLIQCKNQHYIKTVRWQSCSAINCLLTGINILAGGSFVPLISERKWTDPHWKHLRCTHFASSHGTRDVIASLVTSLHLAHSMASSLKLAVRCLVSGCWPSCYIGFSSFGLLWPPCVADGDIIFLPCDFYLSSSFFFSS